VRPSRLSAADSEVPHVGDCQRTIEARSGLGRRFTGRQPAAVSAGRNIHGHPAITSGSEHLIMLLINRPQVHRHSECPQPKIDRGHCSLMRFPAREASIGLLRVRIEPLSSITDGSACVCRCHTQPIRRVRLLLWACPQALATTKPTFSLRIGGHAHFLGGPVATDRYGHGLRSRPGSDLWTPTLRPKRRSRTVPTEGTDVLPLHCSAPRPGDHEAILIEWRAWQQDPRTDKRPIWAAHGRVIRCNSWPRRSTGASEWSTVSRLV
jgi:hypothetical protein